MGRQHEKMWAEEKAQMLQRIEDLKDDLDRQHFREVEANEAMAALTAQHGTRMHEPQWVMAYMAKIEAYYDLQIAGCRPARCRGEHIPRRRAE